MGVVQPVEFYGAARGIDQSAAPGPNTVVDMCNIDVSGGVWKLRPGWKLITVVDSNAGWDPHGPAGITEYVPDLRYLGSNYYAILAHDVSGGVIYELSNSVTAATALTIPTTQAAVPSGVSSVRAIRRYLVGTTVKYVPCLLMTYGGDLFLYDQASGTGSIRMLDVQDGGQGLTYLGTPPKPKYLEVFKERTFGANVENGGNRIYWTTSDVALVFTCNVWPAAYNADVGGASPITGLKAFKDRLVVFKSDSIWSLSGDGVSGAWTINLEDGKHGAVNGYSIIDVGDSILFLGVDGIYRWAGGEAERISHPRLRSTWDKLTTASSQESLAGYTYAHMGFIVPNAVYDKQNNRAIFAFGDTGKCAQYLVYDLTNDTWARWGRWLSIEDDTATDINEQPTVLARLEGWTSEPVVCGLVDSEQTPGAARKLNLCQLSERARKDDYRTTKYIPWFIKTQRYFVEDPTVKLLRQYAISAKQTGHHYITVLPITDDESIIDALRAEVGATNWCVILDSNDAAEHTANNSNFQTGGTAGTYVLDMMIPFIRQDIREESTARRLANATGTYKVKYFSHASPITTVSGKSMVLKSVAGSSTIGLAFTRHSLSPGRESATSSTTELCTLGATVIDETPFAREISGCNRVGRSFALLITNAGTPVTDPDTDPVDGAGCPMEIEGWGLWIIPKGVLRP